MATINVKDASGATVALEKPLTPGATTASASRPVTLATDDALVTAVGAKTDAKNTATDTTAVSLISVAKQVSASVQTVATNSGSALPAGSAVIGKVGIDQTSDGTTNLVAAKQSGSWTATVAASENHLGEVGGKSAYRVITMTTDTAAYASGDLIADTQQYDAFFRKSDGTGVINTITVTEKDAQGAAYYIIFHRTSTSMGTENSAPNITDANLVAGIQHIVTVATTDFVTVSGTKIATLKNLGLPVMAVSGTDDIYISILNSTGTPTYASGEIQLGIGVLLD